MAWFGSPEGAVLWRCLSVLVLLWLAFFFGRTLRKGQTPLIERIARVSDPELSEPLQRYTRGLTTLWSAYFVLAAWLIQFEVLPSALPPVLAGAVVWLGSALLFVVERWLRPHFFPGNNFPGLLQQLRDTWSVWRPVKRAAD